MNIQLYDTPRVQEAMVGESYVDSRPWLEMMYAY